jgi:hypothetical protein
VSDCDPINIGFGDRPSVRYTVHTVHDPGWGGTKWAIWDNEMHTWADNLGRYLAFDAADAAATTANAEAEHA